MKPSGTRWRAGGAGSPSGSGCGSVSHLVPRTYISTEWGRPAEGEKDDGVIAPMGWKRDAEGRPT